MARSRVILDVVVVGGNWKSPSAVRAVDADPSRRIDRDDRTERWAANQGTSVLNPAVRLENLEQSRVGKMNRRFLAGEQDLGTSLVGPLDTRIRKGVRIDLDIPHLATLKAQTWTEGAGRASLEARIDWKRCTEHGQTILVVAAVAAVVIKDDQRGGR